MGRVLEVNRRGLKSDHVSLVLTLIAVSDFCCSLAGIKWSGVLFLTTEPLVLYVFIFFLHSGTVSVRTLQHCGGVCLCMCECGTGFLCA